MNEGVQVCPVCGLPVAANVRYPDYLCGECTSLATSADGRQLAFSNEGFSGGFVAWYRDDKSPYAGHLCYVGGVQCWADEAHMGGIVVRPSPDGQHPIGGKAAA